MAALPRNLITHILIRLPVKFLLRFRCVSKSFCSLIDSQEFIKLHLKHSAATITNPGFFLQDPVSWKLSYTTLCSIDAVQIVKCCDDDDSIIGCCDGLAALTCDQRNRVLWNPSTKKSRALPKILIDVEDCAMNAVDGLGYDASTDDYKWVRIVQSPKHYLVSIVYSLKSNSWRRAHKFPFDSSGQIVGHGALGCGTLSWMAVEYSLPRGRGKYVIIGFDLKDEKFRLVPLPDIKDDLSAHLSLEGLRGRLWLSYTTQRSSSTWVMKKFGVRKSWTKMFSFSPKGESCYWLPGAAFDLFTYFVRPFAYTKTGKKVLLFERSRGLCVYYLDEFVFDSIKIPAPSPHSQAVRLCVESLVPLDAGTRIGVLNGEQREREISCKRKIERGAHHHPRPVEEVFGDYKGRRAGIIKALTSDVKVFYQQCDPEKDELCLYGFPDEQWKVDSPAQEIPIDLPEPAVGVNFSRDGMPEDDWLFSIAVHSDAWLLAVAFSFGALAGFDEADRKRLFDMINELPSVSEVVTTAAKENLSVSNQCSNKSQSNPIAGRSEPQAPMQLIDEEHEHDNSLCGACGKEHASDGFWILCDICEKWFHGTCVKITPARAKHIKLYKCPFCRKKKARA